MRQEQANEPGVFVQICWQLLVLAAAHSLKSEGSGGKNSMIHQITYLIILTIAGSPVAVQSVAGVTCACKATSSVDAVLVTCMCPQSTFVDI